MQMYNSTIKMIRGLRTIYVMLIVLCIQSTMSWASVEERSNRIDSLAKVLAENVIREIEQRHVQNEYLRSIGAVGSVDFIIDMRKWHISKESPSLASSPFLTSDQEKSLNSKLNQFYDGYRHPVYIVLSPIIHGSYELSTQGLKDVYDWLGQEMSFSDFQKLKERYSQYLKELQKYKATAPAMTGALSHGAILSVESYIFYKSNTKKWMVRYGSDFTLSDEIKRASFIEDEYETATEDDSKFEFAAKRYTALDNYTAAITTAFKNNCLPFDKLEQLASILKENLAELSKPIYIKVMEPKTWALQKRAYYLDKREQERYESLIEDTQGGGLLFVADDDGYINLNDCKRDGQKASAAALLEAVGTIEEALLSVSMLWDIWNKSGDFDLFQNNGKPKAEILLDESKEGNVTAIDILPSVISLRKESISKISNDLLSEDELRVAISALFSIQEALKYTFGDKSLYPFAQIRDLKKINSPQLDRYKIEPSKNDKELLQQLKYLYENQRSTLTDSEIERYFQLLCEIEKDCRGAVDLTRVQKISGRYPINAEDYAGRIFYFQLDKNPILLERWAKLSNAQQEAKRKEFELLAQKYPDGVRFTVKGFPDFYPYAYIYSGKVVEVDIVKLNPDPVGAGTKGSKLDMNEANKKMKEVYPEWSQPFGTTWHHIENGTKLLLVPTDIHQAVRHNGGRSTQFSSSEECSE
jgi:hypothetical protein